MPAPSRARWMAKRRTTPPRSRTVPVTASSLTVTSALALPFAEVSCARPPDTEPVNHSAQGTLLHTVTGTVVTAENRVHGLRGFNITEPSRRALKAAHLPTRYAGLGRRSDRPGRYIAVVTQIRGTLAFFGADVAVLKGVSVAEIIGLDKMVTVGRPFTLALPIALPPLQPLR